MHKRMVAISFKIPEELYEELKIAASERNTSKSAILRALVESFVNQRKLKYRRYIGRGIVIW
jgi:predicted DNA-binding protein